jgi:twitching motility protein PilT
MIKDWISTGHKRGASDLLLEAGTPAVLRVRGELTPFGEAISADLLMNEVEKLLDATQWQEFVQRRSADVARTISGTRCRIHVFQTVRGAALAIRLLSSFQTGIRVCNLHPDLRKFLDAKTGLIIVSGPTGSGKSTTLAAFIEEVNQSQRRHILMVDSPIEYSFTNHRSFIRQREVPTHAPSFEQAIVDAMRENPDVLVIGEVRTPAAMRLTLDAAETGHLVLATMHSSTCAEAISRICLSFPAEIQSSITIQLADCLNGVICQRLMYLPYYQLRVPHCEILVANSATKANIRAGQFTHLLSAIQTGAESGMWSFERYAQWIEKKKDWIKPSQATQLDEDPSPAPPETDKAVSPWKKPS